MSGAVAGARAEDPYRQRPAARDSIARLLPGNENLPCMG
jgi:hypothetical protein